MKRLALAATPVALAALISSNALATTNTTNKFNVSMTVVPACVISGGYSSVSYNLGDGFSFATAAAATLGGAAWSITCTKGLPANVYLDTGAATNAQATSVTTSYTDNLLPYTLTLGGTGAGAITGTGVGLPVTMTAGSIASGNVTCAVAAGCTTVTTRTLWVTY